MYINQEICNYYQERLNKNKLFKKCNLNKVSIHRVININTDRVGTIRKKSYSINSTERKILRTNKFYSQRSNDINLLKSVLKTSKEKEYKLLKYLESFKPNKSDRRICNFIKWAKKIKQVKVLKG